MKSTNLKLTVLFVVCLISILIFKLLYRESPNVTKINSTLTHEFNDNESSLKVKYPEGWTIENQYDCGNFSIESKCIKVIKNNSTLISIHISKAPIEKIQYTMNLDFDEISNLGTININGIQAFRGYELGPTYIYPHSRLIDFVFNKNNKTFDRVYRTEEGVNLEISYVVPISEVKYVSDINNSSLVKEMDSIIKSITW